MLTPTFTGTVTGVTKAMVGLGNVTDESKTTMFASPTFTGTVTGVTKAMVGLGNVTDESKTTMFASPTFTGTVTGVTKAMVGLGNVTDESKTTMFASPTFTGTVTGVSKAMVGLGSADDTSDADKPISTATAQRLLSIEGDVTDIEALIPVQAATDNQLADKRFVNSSIATNTANFKGTYHIINDLELLAGASRVDVQAALKLKVPNDPEITNNDYVFVSTPDGENLIFDRYKFAASENSWVYEYELNNSSFSAEQWAAINSGATSTDIISIASKVNSDAIIGDATTLVVANATTALKYTASTEVGSIEKRFDDTDIEISKKLNTTAIAQTQSSSTTTVP